MKKLSNIAAAAILCAVAGAVCSAPMPNGIAPGSIQESEASSSLASVSKSLPVLVAAVSAGSDKACLPTHLTVSGKAQDGSRLYVSALVPEFASQLRKSARGSAKLTREQARDIQRLIDYATQAQKTGDGLSQAAVESLSQSSGLSLQANMICLQRETFGSR